MQVLTQPKILYYKQENEISVECYSTAALILTAFFPMAFPLEYCEKTDLGCLQNTDKRCVPPRISKNKS